MKAVWIIVQKATVPRSRVQGRQQAPVSRLDCRAAVGAASDISSESAASQLCVSLRGLLVSLQAALVQRWSQLDPGARQGVKQATLTALSSQVRARLAQIVLAATRGSSTQNLPRTAAQEVTKLACQGSACACKRVAFQLPEFADKTAPVTAMAS